MKVILNFTGHTEMGRRKKGRDLSGWILVDKPAGMTSSAVVNKLRWLFDANKAGHGGTLDPDATGLLPIAFGEATKLLPFLDEAYKTYEFRVNWGAQTTSDDSSGEVIATSDIRPSQAEIEAIMPLFRGDILQTPPQVSAVKVDGKRAYDLAREGVLMDLKSRSLFVEKLDIRSYAADTLDLIMSCGKGGYVRSIARDLGAQLGCYGHVKYLRRLSCLGFGINDAIEFDSILENKSENIIIPISQTPIIKQIEVSDREAEDLGHGRHLERGMPCTDECVALAMCGNLPIAIVACTKETIEVRRGLHMRAQSVIS